MRACVRVFVTCRPASLLSEQWPQRHSGCPLSTHTDPRSPQPLLCLLSLPLPSSVPSVSIATGQNKLLIIGHRLSWQVVYNEVCHILFQTGTWRKSVGWSLLSVFRQRKFVFCSFHYCFGEIRPQTPVPSWRAISTSHTQPQWQNQDVSDMINEHGPTLHQCSCVLMKLI